VPRRVPRLIRVRILSLLKFLASEQGSSFVLWCSGLLGESFVGGETRGVVILSEGGRL